MDEPTWTSIETHFNRWPQVRSLAVDSTEFDSAMAGFEPNIDSDYREFVIRFGGGVVGPNPIYGLRKTEWMGTVGGKYTAPDVTRWFRDKRWPGTENWLIFSIDQGGNPVGFGMDKTIWLSDQTDFRQVVQIASCFEDYLLKWCLKVRKIE